jgi:hypothetical protein
MKISKKCPNCGLVREFAKNKARSDGLASWCKICSNALSKKIYQKNKKMHTNRVLAARMKRIEKHREVSREYAKKRRTKLRGNIEYEFRKLLSDTKKRAKKKNIVFILTLEQLLELYRLQNGKCAMSGRKLELGNKKRGINSLSIDRIDSDGGYIYKNIRFVVWGINVAMAEWGEGYLRKVYKKIYEYNEN